ncbi:MAG: hypothetical protein R3E76_06485 [Planctomycetota bacterium]
MSSPSVYRKITRALFWGIAILLSGISWVVMDRLDLLWNIWANLADSLIVLVAAFALSRLIPRWLNVADDR